MNYKYAEEIMTQRMAIADKKMAIALTLSAADGEKVFEEKVKQMQVFSDQLEALPTVEEARNTPVKLGRPVIIDNAKSRPVKITLPANEWAHIEMLIDTGRVGSYAEYFRDLHQSSLNDFLEV